MVGRRRSLRALVRQILLRRAGSLGIHPAEMEEASDEEFQRVFDDPEHQTLSVYAEGEHIGEVHIAIEESLGDGQLSILIGRKDMWHHGFGTAAAQAALDLGFGEFGLFRVWVDIPEYNAAAKTLFEQDRKSTRPNSSHKPISYAVFCFKKKNPPPTP